MSEPETWQRSRRHSFLMWCLPTFVAPLVIALFGDAIPVGVFLAFFTVLWMGLEWAAKSVPPERRISGLDKGRIWLKAIVFTLAQCVIIPAAIIGAFHAFCAITGQGRI